MTTTSTDKLDQNADKIEETLECHGEVGAAEEWKGTVCVTL